MALFDPITPNTLFKPHLPATLNLTQAVTVTASDSDSRLWTVSWTAVSTAVRYIVYASPSPTNRNKLADVHKGQTSLQFRVPIVVPDDIVFYFWVGVETPSGAISLLNEEPAYTMNNSSWDTNPLSTATERDIIYNADTKFYIEEFRRRNLALLEMDGEDFDLHIRRMYGQPCKCLTQSLASEGRVTPMSVASMEQLEENFDPFETSEAEENENSDPEYQSAYRCELCFGTSIAGGYYPKIRIKARYGEIPRRVLIPDEQGITYEHAFSSWTIWHPRLKANDFLIRVGTGERFLITQAGESKWRKATMHQEFNVSGAPRTAMLYSVTNAAIENALRQEGAWDIGSWDWSVWS